ncbi:short-chain dehydrogenase [Metaplanococcus flavidus]|uniref:Short-chain dehydrogenase n=1 Tax=Metaplanococcus flavidus TaxID=569883 RepID=A0ABW3LA30_9BACL
MSSTHEFGLIDHIDSQKNFDRYSPEKYNCISIDGDIVESLYENLLAMETYFHSLDRPEFGLAYYGVTLIPPNSLPFFFNVVTSSRDFENSERLNELAIKIQQAIKEKKHMIHYGI